MTGKIAITPRSLSSAGHPALSLLTDKGYELVYPNPGKTPSEDDLMKVIPDCVGWLAGVEPISEALLKASPNLKVISRNGVGVNNVPLAAAEAAGISVEKALGANSRGVAEFAITLLMSAFRHVPWSHKHLSSDDWQRRIGGEVQGRTLGLVGCGAIGRTVAQLAIGLGMEVIGYDPYPPKDLDMPGMRLGTLDEVITQSDAISLHCPPSEKPLITKEVVDGFKPGLVLINTARAELIDEDAIVAGYESGQVSCYATDVFMQEPPVMTALLSHERTILTPHAGGFTTESVERATRTAAENILKVLES